MRLAKALAIDPDPKKGGTESKIIVYLIFPGSISKWMPPKTWFDTANTLAQAWGGITRLKQIAAEI
jgi:hypothetical protein